MGRPRWPRGGAPSGALVHPPDLHPEEPARHGVADVPGAFPRLRVHRPGRLRRRRPRDHGASAGAGPPRRGRRGAREVQHAVASRRADRRVRDEPARDSVRGRGALDVSARLRGWSRCWSRPPGGSPSIRCGATSKPGRGRDEMKLCQFYLPGKGTRVGVVDGDHVVDITSGRAGVGSVRELIETCETAERIERRARRLLAGARTRVGWRELDRAPSPRRAHLLAPLDPPEVWGASITYRRSMQYYEAHTDEGGRTKGIYDHVYESERPDLFFKATASRTVGPNGAIGIRRDSALTAVEPELAVIVGGRGRIVGYTVGNDLSAWDIERANPLFLPQSKIFAGCFAMGPVLATPQEVGDPGSLALTCRILRDGRLRYEGRVNTKEMKRPCAELVEWLGRSNPVPAGTVLSTGTGILVPDEHALSAGDIVEIELERVGTLRNVVRRLP